MIGHRYLNPSIFAISLVFAAANFAQAYTDTEGTDFIIDAPWRTVRDYVPVLFFAAEPRSAHITKLELLMFDPATSTPGALIFSDDLLGSDKTTCTGAGATHDIEIVDDLGALSTTLQTGIVADHWHYIARIPTACLGAPGLVGQPGPKLLLGKITTVGAGVTTKVLRVIVDPTNPLPKFSNLDRHFDIHFHTIAEQTDGTALDIDNGYKAFGGPIAMLVESAYAIGMLDHNLVGGNWHDFRNQLAITDHNAFYSTSDFDQGGSPGAGPTANKDNGSEEFQWYRDTFGDLAGEEITLPGTGALVASGIPDWGSHFLSYGAQHFDGPWHGGDISVKEIAQQYLPNFFGSGLVSVALKELLEDIPRGKTNPLILQNVLENMGQSNGFGYAAHPFSSNFGWSTQYFQTALGWGPFGTTERVGPSISASGKDFVYKGSQVWNGKHDRVSKDDLASSESGNLDPFSSSGGTQKFVGNDNWASALSGPMTQYLEHVAGGLKFSFSNNPDQRFIRKVYMSAGTDAHGDFNYSTSIPATIILEIAATSIDGVGVNETIGEPKIMTLDANAFGRVRTYALAGDRGHKSGEFVDPRLAPDLLGALDEVANASPSDIAVQAYRDGNTVLTDGPICMFHLDSNCRFNSDGNLLSWHDASCTFENLDGSIGGNGTFDGSRSALVPRGVLDPTEIWVQTQWKGKNDYIYSLNDPSEMHLELLGVGTGSQRLPSIPAGQESKLTRTALDSFVPSDKFYRPSALLLRGTRGEGLNSALCLTNPIWNIPYTISIRKPVRCPIKPGELTVTAKFGVSMEPTIKNRCQNNDCVGTSTSAVSYKGAQITIVELGRDGKSIGSPIFLEERRWRNNNMVVGGGRINNASLTATNQQAIACPTSRWDANIHSNVGNIKSYAVVVSDLLDMHLNRLNAIGKTFTVLPPASGNNTTTNSDTTTNAPPNQ